MKSKFTLRKTLFVFLSMSIAATCFADGILIPFGSTWKYLADGSNQGTAWTGTAFADGTWPSGPAQIGWGDGGEQTALGTKPITAYFRTTVSIVNPTTNYGSFNINIYADDAAIVYVNGVQVAITNITTTGLSNTKLATGAAAENGHVIQTFNIAKTSFTNGVNTIAVELHQMAASDADAVFDLELVGVGTTAEPAITRGPMLQMVGTTAISIKWTTASATTSRINYGSAPGSLTSNTSSATSTTDHELRISGLTADTKYYYAIGSQSSVFKGSYRTFFTTAPLANSTRKIRVGFFGDGGTGTAFQKGTRDAYLRTNKNGGTPELAMMLGDNAYNNGLDAQYATAFFAIYNDNIMNNEVVYSVPGNHEYDNDATANPAVNLRYTHSIPYYSIYSLPTAAESGGLASGTEHYYSVDYGPIHFVMLDSYGYDGSVLLSDTTGPQALWLKNDLTANAGTHKWTIVCMHHPPYTNGSHVSGVSTDASPAESDLVAIRHKLTPIFERFGVDLVIAGHSHVYERTFLIKDHQSFATSFTNALNMVNGSSARYDGTGSSVATSDLNAATGSCPYFSIDSTYDHGTVYVVAGSAGQLTGPSANAKLPAFYYRNYSGSSGAEGGDLYVEVQDNRLDAKFVGTSGSVRDQFTVMKGVNKKTTVKTTVSTPVSITSSWIGAYNWYLSSAPGTSLGTTRTISVSKPSIGTYTFYVNDSLSPKTTCIADTFSLQVLTTLAVSVDNFNAYPKGNKVETEWTTTQEVNSDFFTLEKSADGKDFDLEMIINAQGNSSTPVKYQYEDNKPLPGKSYYRLIETDRDGNVSIIGIREVNFGFDKSFAVSVSPNPARNNQVIAYIECQKSQQLFIKAVDMGGATIYSNSMKVNSGSNNLRFNLPTGSYVLNIEAADGTKSSQVLIVK